MMPLAIKVGTCGWSLKGGKSAYFRSFEVIELQNTFYRIPSSKTLEKYREESPTDFEFVVKAWQAITHPVSSPTWRKSGLIPALVEPARFGHLRPSPENFRAWELILETCRALRSRFVVVQTPPSFACNEINKSNMSLFFSSIERKGLQIGWEPRGDWKDHPDEIRELCGELSLIHVLDPLRVLPMSASNADSASDTAYFRLHGLGVKETNYGYKYTEEDLAKLASIVAKHTGCWRLYVMFNNVHMGSDALRLKRKLFQSSGFRV